MNKKITTYVICVARSKYKTLIKILLCCYLVVTVAIRFLSIPHKAEVRLVTNIPPNQLLANQNNTMENFTGGGPFSLDRDTFIASQEVLLTSLPLYEIVQKKAELEVTEVMSGHKQPSDYFSQTKKFFQLLLFGKEYTENLGLWKNPQYTRFIDRLKFTPRPDDGTFIIGYTDTEPLTAIRIAGYITEGLIQLNIKMARDESNTIASFLLQRVEKAKATAQEASAKLATFLREFNLPSDPSSLRDRYNLYVSALREDDNSTRSKMRAEARLESTEQNIKALEESVNKSVLTGMDIKVDNLLAELKRIQSAEVKNRTDEGEREIASDYFGDQTEPIRQKLANEIAKYGTYAPLKDLLDLLSKSKLELAKQKQSLAEDNKYDQFTREMLIKYSEEAKTYPEFQTKLSALLTDITQKTQIADQLYQEYLKYSVKSESQVSRVYALQKPMIVSGLVNSGKFKTLFLVLVLLTLLVPLIAGLYHLLNGTIYSKHQIMRRVDTRFVGVFPTAPSLEREQLEAFCLSSESIFRYSLETTHALQRVNETNGKIIAMASAAAGNGTSVCTFGLAKGLARLHHSVLVIDCDFLSIPGADGVRHSGVTRFFSADSKTEESILDMEQIIAKLVPNATTKQQQGISFCKMVRGNVEQKVYVEILKEKFSQQLQNLKLFYDYIILDGPALSVTEGLMLIEQANGVMLCCAEGSMSESEFSQALAIINQHKNEYAAVLTLLSNSKIPENITLEDNYGNSPHRAAA